MRIYEFILIAFLGFLSTRERADASSSHGGKETQSHCFLDLLGHKLPPFFTFTEEDPTSALAAFASDFAFSSQAASMQFVSYAINGAAGVYVNSIGLAIETKATDALGREITVRTRRLLSPDEWAQVLRAANLQISVAFAQLNTAKALLVINLSADAEPLSAAFSPERRLKTFLSILAWSRLPQVSEELRFFLSRVEAFILVEAPEALAESRHALEALLFSAAFFFKDNNDTDDMNVINDIYLLSSISSACSPIGFPPEIDENNSHCQSIRRNAARSLELRHQHLDGRQVPRLHLSPVGDIYYLKRFFTPSEMPSFYSPHSVQTLERSKEQQEVSRFLTDCLPAAFASQRLRYPHSADSRSGISKALETAVGSFKLRLSGDGETSESQEN